MRLLKVEQHKLGDRYLLILECELCKPGDKCKIQFPANCENCFILKDESKITSKFAFYKKNLKIYVRVFIISIHFFKDLVVFVF